MIRAPRRALAVHSSGRFDRSVESMMHSVRRLRRHRRGARRVAYITGTEASGRSHRDLERILGSDPGWDYTHIEGRASGECWATWHAGHAELARQPFTRPLTTMTWRRSAEYGGAQAPPVEALVVPLRPVGRRYRRTLYVIVLHAPLDNTELRAAIWHDVCRGLRTLVTRIRAGDPTAVFAIEADWNKDYRTRAERTALEQAVAKPLRLVQGWDGSTPTRSGTHDRRLIDGVVASRWVLGMSTPWCWLAPDDRSSDHRPYVHTLRWPLLPKRLRALITKEKT